MADGAPLWFYYLTFSPRPDLCYEERRRLSTGRYFPSRQHILYLMSSAFQSHNMHA